MLRIFLSMLTWVISEMKVHGVAGEPKVTVGLGQEQSGAEMEATCFPASLESME